MSEALSHYLTYTSLPPTSVSCTPRCLLGNPRNEQLTAVEASVEVSPGPSWMPGLYLPRPVDLSPFIFSSTTSSRGKNILGQEEARFLRPDISTASRWKAEEILLGLPQREALRVQVGIGKKAGFSQLNDTHCLSPFFKRVLGRGF